MAPPKKKIDPLIDTIENTLNFGQFVSYNYTHDFIHELEEVQQNIDDLIELDPHRAVKLYEIFLHGCTEKINEMDDSGGNMGMFFSHLFCSWVIARQNANLPAKETLELINKWQESDEYGLCYDIEKELIDVFNRETLNLFKNNLISDIEEYLKLHNKNPTDRILNDKIKLVKYIYAAKKNLKAYIEFSQKFGVTLKDCEEIAKIYQKNKKYNDALDWVEKGLKFPNNTRDYSFSKYDLTNLKKELLKQLGNKSEALNMAWSDFKKHPNKYAYLDLMKYVPVKDKNEWKIKAIDHIKDGPLEAVFEICMITKEYPVLVDQVMKCKHQTLENLSHYKTEEAANILSKKYPEAAAKIYRALGMRIVESKKSKYYHASWDHFEKAKGLYIKTGQEEEWKKLADNILREHSRKSGFISGFMEVVDGNKKKKLSLADRAKQRWKKQ